MGKPVKYEIPEDARAGVCKGTNCRADIWWFKLPSGKWICCDADGTPHWASCRDRKQFRKGAKEAKND